MRGVTKREKQRGFASFYREEERRGGSGGCRVACPSIGAGLAWSGPKEAKREQDKPTASSSKTKVDGMAIATGIDRQILSPGER